jgi:tetratricopeptide (TPR) repeat protein
MLRTPLIGTLAFLASLTFASICSGQALHQIEGRVRAKGTQLRGIRVKLVAYSGMRTITETFTNSEGQFTFKALREGNYVIDTLETDLFEATSTTVEVRPPNPSVPTPTIVMVFIDVPLKSADRQRAAVVNVDVDLKVPGKAQKHYRAGMKALESSDSIRAIAELKEAIAIHSQYYAARLELGRQLRLQRNYEEAARVLQPLKQIAPGRAEPRIEYGVVLMNLGQKKDAARVLNEALRLEESNWVIHLYLGWAVLEIDEDSASVHFKRALELDQQNAARAHLGLGQIANNKGLREEAIKHLVAYLTLAPNAPDAAAVRRLAESLRK